MQAQDITCSQNLGIIKNSELALINFSTSWCAPCALQEPIIQKIAQRFAGKLYTGMVDIDECTDMAFKFGIHSVPTLIIFQNGQEAQRFIGLQSERTLTASLKKMVLHK